MLVMVILGRYFARFKRAFGRLHQHPHSPFIAIWIAHQCFAPAVTFVFSFLNDHGIVRTGTVFNLIRVNP